MIITGYKQEEKKREINTLDRLRVQSGFNLNREILRALLDYGSISLSAKINLNCESILTAKQSVMSQYKSLW